MMILSIAGVQGGADLSQSVDRSSGFEIEATFGNRMDVMTATLFDPPPYNNALLDRREVVVYDAPTGGAVVDPPWAVSAYNTFKNGAGHEQTSTNPALWTVRLFAGYLATPQYTLDGAMRLIALSAQDYTYRLRTTVVNQAFAAGLTDQQIVTQIFNKYRPDFVTSMVMNTFANMPAISFPVHTLEQFLQKIIKITGAIYRVDYYKQVWYGPIGQMLTPYNLSETPNYFVPYLATVLRDSPVAYWRLSDSGATALDATGQGFSGTVGAGVTEGVTSALNSDIADRSMTFNGSTGKVTLPSSSSLHPGDVFSLELWFKSTDATTTGHPMWDGGTGDFIFRYGNGGAGVVDVGISGGAAIAHATGAYNDGNWHHAVWVKNGAQNHLYVDGVDRITSLVNLTVVAASTNETLGLRVGGNSFAGSLDEVALYNYPLTAAQVANHYAVGSAAPTATTIGYEQGTYIPDAASLVDKVWVVGRDFLSAQQTYQVPTAIVDGTTYQFPLPGATTKGDLVSVKVNGVFKTIGQAPGDGDVTNQATFKTDCLVQSTPATIAFAVTPPASATVLITGKFRYPLIQTLSDPTLVAAVGGLYFEAVVRDKRIRDVTLAQNVGKRYLATQGSAKKGFTATLIKRGVPLYTAPLWGSSQWGQFIWGDNGNPRIVAPGQTMSVTAPVLFAGLGTTTKQFVVSRTRIIMDADTPIDDPYRLELELIDRASTGAGY